MRNDEAKLKKEEMQLQAKAQATSVATERLQANEAQAQLRLQEQAQISATLIAELIQGIFLLEGTAYFSLVTTSMRKFLKTSGPGTHNRVAEVMHPSECHSRVMLDGNDTYEDTEM